MRQLQKSSRIRGEDKKFELLNLVISQFNGTCINYFRLWNEIETQTEVHCLSMNYHGILKGMSKKRIYCHQNLENQVNL